MTMNPKMDALGSLNCQTSAQVTLALPKPEKRGPKPRKRIRRSAAPRRTSRPRARRKGETAALVREADRLWSRCILAEARYVCVPCKVIGGVVHRATDAAHVFSRRCMSTRHVLGNGMACCRRMHDYLGSASTGRATRMGAAYSEIAGSAAFALLMRMAAVKRRFDPRSLELLRLKARSLGIS